MQRSFEQSLINASQRIADLAQFFAKNTPSVVAKPVGFVLNTLIGAPIRILSGVITAVKNVFQKSADISDKLTAMMGELKNSIEKKISDAFSSLKKKVKSLFSIFKPLDTDDKQIKEAKRTFELKTFIHDLYRKIIRNNEDGDKSA